jgi:hypothetical protein
VAFEHRDLRLRSQILNNVYLLNGIDVGVDWNEDVLDTETNPDHTRYAVTNTSTTAFSVNWPSDQTVTFRSDGVVPIGNQCIEES